MDSPWTLAPWPKQYKQRYQQQSTTSGQSSQQNCAESIRTTTPYDVVSECPGTFCGIPERTCARPGWQ
jgi:hypothetical protein